MRHVDRFAWLLIAAVALAASACGHALELSIENLGWWGDGRANYTHPAQLFAVEMAALLFLIAAVAVGTRLVRCALHKSGGRDCLIPALDGIASLGFVRSAFTLVSLQFVALFGSELLEQRMAGFNGGLASIVGAGHATAIVVHVIVGLLFAFALYRFSRFICAQTRILVGAIARFARRVDPPAALPYPASRHVNLWASARKPPLLALGLANRPPPVPFTIAA